MHLGSGSCLPLSNSYFFFPAGLQHPNIIKLRGISSADPFTQDKTKGNFYFLILDRLCGTLSDRMKVWREQKRQLKTLIGRITDISGRKRQALMDTRMGAAYDLSAAVSYLETQRILHRDLKPENIVSNCSLSRAFLFLF